MIESIPLWVSILYIIIGVLFAVVYGNSAYKFRSAVNPWVDLRYTFTVAVIGLLICALWLPGAIVIFCGGVVVAIKTRDKRND